MWKCLGLVPTSSNTDTVGFPVVECSCFGFQGPSDVDALGFPDRHLPTFWLAGRPDTNLKTRKSVETSLNETSVLRTSPFLNVCFLNDESFISHKVCLGKLGTSGCGAFHRGLWGSDWDCTFGWRVMLFHFGFSCFL